MLVQRHKKINKINPQYLGYCIDVIPKSEYYQIWENIAFF